MNQVCVVEDNPFLRIEAWLLFEEAGFDVAQFASEDLALANIERRAADVIMVFADIRLPSRLDGLELVQRVSHSWPWIKLVVTSGAEWLVEGKLPPNATYLPKPWLPAEVLAHALHAEQRSNGHLSHGHS